MYRYHEELCDPSGKHQLYTREAFDKIRLLMNVAISATAKPGLHVMYSVHAQHDDISPGYYQFYIMGAGTAFSQDRSDYCRALGAAVAKEFPLRQFKGSTDCGRGIDLQKRKQPEHMSAHQLIQNYEFAQQLFGDDSPIQQLMDERIQQAV